MLDQVTGYFFPVKNPGEEERARAQLVILAMFGGTAVAILSAVALVLMARYDRAAISVLGALAYPPALFLLRRTRSIQLSTQVMGAVATLCYASTALVMGDPTQLVWVAAVPFVVMLLSSARWAIFWLTLNAALISGICLWFAADPSRLHLPSHAVMLWRAVVFALAVFLLNLISAMARARIQKSLQAARDEADRANKLKTEFLANFSHEIRTPLNGVLGTADGLLAGELDREVREQLLIIQRSGSSLLRTINDVLELSRVEAGRLELFPVATELPVLLREVGELFRARAVAKGLRLELVLEPGHPQHVTVDDLRLRQVVQNLVGNAVKFTSEGQVVVRLSNGATAAGQVITRISVEDTGPGIDPEVRARLFSAFTQARPRTDRAEGTGLGLAISSQFIELMGGTLKIDSAPVRGSIFTIELLLPVAVRANTPAAFRAVEVEGAPDRKLKVLVVDDNEINLKVAVTLLGRLGHELVMARDGEQALTAIAQHQPDVVFMDCHMPVLDGLDATRRLRASGDERPVVALTASVYAEDKQRCLAAGMTHFVSKPVTIASLRKVLREAKPPVSPTVVKPEPVTTHRRVLVVDDDPHVRRMTVRLLRAEGFEVNDAADIEAALILFERSAPSHLLVDRVLGGTEDGMSFAERLTHKRNGLHVVVTSGEAPSDEQLASLKAAGGQFLAKPYDRQRLIASLSKRAA
jgi:signal transduction histidine kinase/CheY-like chemotaxis protein